METTLIPTFSPQGDGNLPVIFKMELETLGSVDPYLFPARGRKRGAGGTHELALFESVDPYLFPARGRKLLNLAYPPLPEFLLVDPYLFPARGRKLSQ